MNNEVRVEDVDIGKIAAIKHQGSFKEFNLIFKQMESWIKDNNFKNTGTYFFRFDPEYKDLSRDNLLFELGISVKNIAKNENLAKIYQILDRDVISALYKGPYSNLPSIHGILEDYARKNDLAPMDSPTEIYLNDPFEVKSNDLLTEVQFTVFDFKSEDIPYVPLFSKIERKTIEKQTMAIIEHYGLIEDVYKVRIDLIKWAEKHNIKVDAIHFKHYFNPEGITPRGMVFKAGTPVDDDFKGDGDMKIVEVPEHEVLSAVYKGPYVNIPNVTRMMVDYAFENNFELIDFAEEIYLNSIFDVSCDDLLTEVRMDVIDFNFDRNIKLEKEIERKTIEIHQIASIRQTGSFQKVNKIKTDLFNWIEKNNIKTSGNYFLRFHNHPRSLSPENISYEIGIPIDGDVEDLILVIDFPIHKILYYTHKGPISTLKNTHDFIYNYAKENEFIPINIPVNSFIDKFPENIEDEQIIEVGLPVKKI
ncbi:MAG: GyrI-like domain-containing protein [Methanobacteriaceae archaeon]|jgi:effector-binding domain-containing protein|nr:GyrI-like domain-containing protein [Candidatus Methanorudis spinitermitis]